MKEIYQDMDLINNAEMRQFEMMVNGHKAVVEYEINDGKMYLTHAQVPEEIRHQGVGEALAEKIMMYLETKNLKLVPMCSFIKYFLKKSPQWQKLIATGILLE
ncbi:MAG TPA: GNAT family N-acetyltransferase [Flavobacteriales bacterium]